MIRFLICFSLAIVALSLIITDPAQGTETIFLVALLSSGLIFVFRRHASEKDFVTYVFLAALAARLICGLIIHNFDLRMSAGSDAIAYDMNASEIVDYWLTGVGQGDPHLKSMLSLRGAGWGMQYLTAFLYLISDKSILVAQSFCGLIGAATVPLTYFCTEKLFQNRRVARTAAIFVAFFPAFIIWSSQLLKDGLIVFLLVLALTFVVQLQKQFSLLGILIVVLSLFGILSLRFYVFYFVAATVVASFIVGYSNSIKSIVQRLAILLCVAGALLYLGVLRTTIADLEVYGSLERAQASRADLAGSAESGFGRGENVSTVGGAISALPIGFLYLMFAPFPWEVRNFRQSITLPDALLWWSVTPLLIYGVWYCIKNKLRVCFPILFFSSALTVFYSIFQGNVGTAYRQRTQVQVFFFIFIAVGWTLLRERMEDRKLVELNRKRELERKLRARFQQPTQV